MKTCPKLGHLVRPRKNSALAKDISDNRKDPWQNCGLIVDAHGIEVQVLLPPGVFSWVRRDNVEVIQ